MPYRDQYENWLKNATQNPEIIRELVALDSDEKAIEERFSTELAFGTGGLRGLMGAGSNRVNVYTVKKATQGLCLYLQKHFETPSVAIAYDSRINSDVFAKAAAEVLAQNGVLAHMYAELTPTPMLSFAVRRLGASAGVVITASHNPAGHNGYKVYGCDGCQITLEAADEITSYIAGVDVFKDVVSGDYQSLCHKGMIRAIPREVALDYYEEVLKQSLFNAKVSGLRVVYSPLHGAGNKPVRTVLKEAGIEDVFVVPEQEKPDGTFATCPSPNPEETDALSLAMQMAESMGADLVLATDPDCDRVGTAVLHNGGYVLVNGNQMGVLLLDFVCRMRLEMGNMPQNPVAIKTIVTSEMAQAVADGFGVKLISVLTGFKFIGEQIGLLEQAGEEERFIFGFEESYGYLAGTYVRDKDAVVASMLICQMAAYYKKQGISLVDALEGLYRKHGFYFEKLESFLYEGISGAEKIRQLMKNLRENPPSAIGGVHVRIIRDYLNSREYENGQEAPILLPPSDVMGLFLLGGSSVIVRPSGTEAKLKVYYSLVCANRTESQKLFEDVSRSMGELLHM